MDKVEVTVPLRTLKSFLDKKGKYVQPTMIQGKKRKLHKMPTS